MQRELIALENHFLSLVSPALPLMVSGSESRRGPCLPQHTSCLTSPAVPLLSLKHRPPAPAPPPVCDSLSCAALSGHRRRGPPQPGGRQGTAPGTWMGGRECPTVLGARYLGAVRNGTSRAGACVRLCRPGLQRKHLCEGWGRDSLKQVLEQTHVLPAALTSRAARPGARREISVPFCA